MSEEMNQEKKATQSLTIVSSGVGSVAQLAALAVIILNLVGFDITESEKEQLIVGLTATIGFIMHIVAIYGRKRAKSKIVK